MNSEMKEKNEEKGEEEEEGKSDTKEEGPRKELDWGLVKISTVAHKKAVWPSLSDQRIEEVEPDVCSLELGVCSSEPVVCSFELGVCSLELVENSLVIAVAMTSGLRLKGEDKKCVLSLIWLS